MNKTSHDFETKVLRAQPKTETSGLFEYTSEADFHSTSLNIWSVLGFFFLSPYHRYKIKAELSLGSLQFVGTNKS